MNDVKHKLVLAGFIFSVCFALIVTALSFGLTSKNQVVTFDNKTIKVEVADTQEELVQGLSNTTQLLEGRGMLFLFASNGFHSIWMKDMNYPIDIVWLNEQKSVVHIEQHIKPESYPRTFIPAVPARYVIELPADATEKYGIKQGDQATFRL